MSLARIPEEGYLKQLLLEAIRILQRIPTAEEGEVIQPEHHNLQTDAIFTLREIAWILATSRRCILSAYNITVSSIGKYLNPPFSWGGPYDISLIDLFPGLPVPYKGWISRLKVHVAQNTMNGPTLIRCLRNKVETGIGVTVPANQTGLYTDDAGEIEFDMNDTINFLIDTTRSTSGEIKISCIAIMYEG